MLRETTSRAHTLTWQYGEMSGRAGYRPNGDRYYLPDSGQGFVQTGLRAWRVLVDPKKGMTWDMVYSGGLSQLPFLEDVRLHPENWGVAPLIPAGTSFRKEGVAADRETWLGTLPEQASVTWHGQPRSLRQVRVTVIKQGAVYLPVRWETLAAGNDPGGVMIGTYTWADPVIPEAPPFPNRDAGLFNVWLGESRESVEPLRFAAAERRTEAGGATWAIGNGVAIKYDAAGKVILLSQTKWDLLNGLAIGDSADAAVRTFGPAARGDQSVLVYTLPQGNRLEIYLKQGRINEFRVVAAGQ